MSHIIYSVIYKMFLLTSILSQNIPGAEKTFSEQQDEDEEMTVCCGSNALFSMKSLRAGWNNLVDIANPDKETKRLIHLGTPLTLAEVSEAVFDALTVALVSHYLGVQALSAYVVANLLVGLSEIFVKGVIESLGTVCAHAIGADNNFLAGQYVQISMIFYCVASVPLMGIWWFFMDDVIRLFGLDDSVAEMGASYAKALIFHYSFVGIFDGCTVLLDIVGYAMHATLYDLFVGTVEIVTLWILLATVDGFNLFWVGVYQLITAASFLIIFLIVSNMVGWLDPFLPGMTRSFALKVSLLSKYDLGQHKVLLWFSLNFSIILAHFRTQLFYHTLSPKL